MAERTPSQVNDQDDEVLSAAFAGVPQRQDPPPGRLDRWEATFRTALAERVAARKQKRLYVVTGLVAVLALFAVGRFVIPPTPVAPVVAVVVADKNGNKLLSGRQSLPVHTGLEVKVGDTLLTGRDGYLALDYRGADVRLSSRTSVRFQAAKLELLDGAVYVDSWNQEGRPALVIATEFGTVKHVGTQYLVEADSEHLSVAVREGVVVVSQATGSMVTLSPEGGGSNQLQVGADGNARQSTVASHGGVWEWVAEVPPPFAIKDPSAHDLLNWATRQLGLALQYEEDAEVVARQPIPGPGERFDDVGHVVPMLEQLTSLRIRQTDSAWVVSTMAATAATGTSVPVGTEAASLD